MPNGNQMTSKEDQIMSFLHEHVFDPVLDAETASADLKKGVRWTITRMRERDAVGMISYFWSAIIGTERSVGFAARLRAEGFTRFEEVLEEFRVKFNDNFIRK